MRYQNFIAEDDTSTTTEGKFGIPRFNGEPTRLAEYTFRVRARTYKEKALGDDERGKLGPLGLRLVEGLSGTALRLAQTLKLEDLAAEDGAEKLLTALEGQLKPKRLQQARELYAAGASVHGILSRQSGPMSSYVLRRRTWYRCLLDCSAEMALPDMVLAEQLLASATISHDHQLLVRTAIKAEVSFDSIADELIAQHGKVHEREKRNFSKGGSAGRHNGGKSWKGARPWRPSGYFADELPEGDLDQDDGALDDVMQAEQEAYFAKKGAAGKGKGFRHPPPRQFQVSGSLSLEERRAKVAALKSRTTCRRCGARGRWRGDAACPMTKGSGKKGKRSTSSSSASSAGHSGTNN